MRVDSGKKFVASVSTILGLLENTLMIFDRSFVMLGVISKELSIVFPLW